ncbi:outer membrane channel protein TolC [Parashewanella spongiae]|uniref:Outer membrane channel protein TolC n=1 Tax=Parashewanella spongiae TaxID=342950 RepID=A0A3A6U0I2_9GAMM|nr:outer membrane channel protein TolC [Parashewanella spongiae]MCL1078322.1 outer membrane channel protein TolC [Parashewanella spongiae]RJY17473.1 outer membrane channel protein TolC [Parashewanella spongiae]
MKFKLKSVCAALTLAVASTAAHADDLLQIYQQALTSDTIVLQAKAQRDSSYAKIEQTRAGLLPTLSGSVGYNKRWGNSSEFTSSGISTGLTLTQSVYDHSVWIGLSLAEKAAAQADSSYASALQELMARVTSSYFDVLTAKDNAEFKIAEKRAIERQLEQTKQRFAVGLTAITDVHEAQAQYDLATASEILAQNTLDNSYEALREITGIDHLNIDALDTERFSAVTPAPQSSKDWIKIAEANSIELIGQRLGKDIARDTIKVYEAGHLPSLNFNAGYSKSFDQDTNDASDTNLNKESKNVGLTLSVPIFQGFAVDSQVEQAKYDYIAASQKLEQTHRSVVKNIRNNFNNVKASISSIKAYQQSVISSESALKATQAGFEVGTRTIVDVLNRTRDLYDSKRQLSDARYGYIKSVFALKQAAGTLSEDDIIGINNGLKK